MMNIEPRNDHQSDAACFAFPCCDHLYLISHGSFYSIGSAAARPGRSASPWRRLRLSAGDDQIVADSADNDPDAAGGSCGMVTKLLLAMIEHLESECKN
jgi:hypothetical protein